MSELGKVTASHLRRVAVIYVRQSTLAQVERNRESTARQYDLVARAAGLGWPRSGIQVIDEDLGVSGASTAGRSGFAELAARVGLGQVGIVVSLEVSRLARNNADWYRLLDLAGLTDTLIADADGVYHPAMVNDRLLLGMKGTMSEAELHILRARLDGGIRNKAARGELRRGLPVGLVWGEADGEILLHPDEAVRGVIAAIFEQFGPRGSARGVWLWLKEHRLKLPLQRSGYVDVNEEITWVEPTYQAVHKILTHPMYAGAYVFGKTKYERFVNEHGVLRTRRRVLPPDQWQVCASPATTVDTSIGTPTRPTRPGSAPTPVRGATSPAPGRCGRVAPCCKGWPPAGPVAASLPCSTTARPRPPPATTAPPGSWSTAVASSTCESAAWRSKRRWSTRSLPRCSRRRCPRVWPPPNSSSTATMRR